MPEMLPVIEKRIIIEKYGVDGTRLIPVDINGFSAVIKESGKIIARDKAEFDDSLKQIVAYCVIKCGDRFFVTRRLKKQAEKRLHDKLSLGLGGHIDSADFGGREPITEGMLRELNEEVDIRCPWTYTFKGLINDDSNPVSAVHTGVCYLISVERPDCVLKETEKTEGFWVDRNDLTGLYDKMEGWSQILINCLDIF